MRQVPLIDTGSSLPSPIFKPRPGWGGKLKSWLRKYGFASLVRAAFIVVALFIIRSFIPHPAPEMAQPTPSPLPVAEMYREIARPGDGSEALASRAVSECLAQHPDLGTLDPVQHLWAVRQLSRLIHPHALRPGDTLSFSYTTVAQTIQAAQHLSALTRASLLPYLNK